MDPSPGPNPRTPPLGLGVSGTVVEEAKWNTKKVSCNNVFPWSKPQCHQWLHIPCCIRASPIPIIGLEIGYVSLAVSRSLKWRGRGFKVATNACCPRLPRVERNRSSYITPPFWGSAEQGQIKFAMQPLPSQGREVLDSKSWIALGIVLVGGISALKKGCPAHTGMHPAH